MWPQYLPDGSVQVHVVGYVQQKDKWELFRIAPWIPTRKIVCKSEMYFFFLYSGLENCIFCISKQMYQFNASKSKAGCILKRCSMDYCNHSNVMW